MKPSRYALAYTAITPGKIITNKRWFFNLDFGDNMFPYFLGNSSARLKDKIEEYNADSNEVDKDYDVLKPYILNLILTFL